MKAWGVRELNFTLSWINNSAFLTAPSTLPEVKTCLQIPVYRQARFECVNHTLAWQRCLSLSYAEMGGKLRNHVLAERRVNPPIYVC